MDTATAAALGQYKATVDAAYGLLVTALTPPPAQPTPVLVGATSAGNDEIAFSANVAALGPLDLHYTFQPSFKADFTTWAGSRCADHLPMASTKWATPTANNFKTLVASIPQDGTTRRIVMYQEPEDNLSASDFQRVVKYLRDAIDESGRTDILLCLDLQCYWNWHKNADHTASLPYIHDAANGDAVYADVIGWSWWPYGKDVSNDMAILAQAMNITEVTGKAFAISSLIMQGSVNAAGLQSELSQCGDMLADYVSDGGTVDHVCAYMESDPVALSDTSVGAGLNALLNRCREGF